MLEMQVLMQLYAPICAADSRFE